MKKINTLMAVEIPEAAANIAAILYAVMLILYAATAEKLVDFYPRWVAPLGMIVSLIMILLIVTPGTIKRPRIHLDQEKIFRDIDGTSNVIEDIVISRIQKDVLFVMANGASNMSLQRDLERIQFIAKTKSMRKVEDFIDKLLLELAIKFYE